jgi:hypothetical protein
MSAIEQQRTELVIMLDERRVKLLELNSRHRRECEYDESQSKLGAHQHKC